MHIVANYLLCNYLFEAEIRTRIRANLDKTKIKPLRVCIVPDFWLAPIHAYRYDKRIDFWTNQLETILFIQQGDYPF